MTRALVAEGLACTRGLRELFDALSFALGSGQVLRIEGANGAGKTSLLRLVAGLAWPSAGRVLWRGAPIATQREAYARELLYLGHAPALKDDLTALENLRAATALSGVPKHDDALRDALAQWGLAGALRLPVRALSAGQRRRTALARTAMSDARLWVLDEPFNALDGAACEQLGRCIERHAEGGGLALVTSHLALPAMAHLRVDSLVLAG